MRRTRGAHTGRSGGCACILAMAVILAGCSRESRSPTEPFPGPGAQPTPPTAWWLGSWTLDEASPAGDCLADLVNQHRFEGWFVSRSLTMTVERDAGSIHVRFVHVGFRAEEGFWPVEFAGTVDADGAVRASVAQSWIGSTRIDPWLDFCYTEWTTLGGELSGTLSPDGQSFTGTVVESFRTRRGDKLFTIRSHFEVSRH